MDNYCKKFVEDIFLKHDKDRSNVLERKELKNWVRDELKSHKFFNKQMVTKEYEEFFAKVDTNNDGKIDRWELTASRTSPPNDHQHNQISSINT
jgi:Ca2+-binding EF-hand superfamily protein